MSLVTLTGIILLVSLTARGNVTRTLWALFNLLDTLRALKHVRRNGRKVGAATRKRLIRQCIVAWVVFVAAQPVGNVSDILLGWFPFYNSIKTLVILLCVTWRVETSRILFQAAVVPAVRRIETHLDLTILLFHGIFTIVFYFFIQLPWASITGALGRIWSHQRPSHEETLLPDMEGTDDRQVKELASAVLTGAPSDDTADGTSRTDSSDDAALAKPISNMKSPGKKNPVKAAPSKLVKAAGGTASTTSRVKRQTPAAPSQKPAATGGSISKATSAMPAGNAALSAAVSAGSRKVVSSSDRHLTAKTGGGRAATQTSIRTARTAATRVTAPPSRVARTTAGLNKAEASLATKLDALPAPPTTPPGEASLPLPRPKAPGPSARPVIREQQPPTAAKAAGKPPPETPRAKRKRLREEAADDQPVKRAAPSRTSAAPARSATRTRVTQKNPPTATASTTRTTRAASKDTTTLTRTTRAASKDPQPAAKRRRVVK